MKEHERGFGDINDLDDELLEELGQDVEPFLVPQHLLPPNHTQEFSKNSKVSSVNLTIKN